MPRQWLGLHMSLYRVCNSGVVSTMQHHHNAIINHNAKTKMIIFSNYSTVFIHFLSSLTFIFAGLENMKLKFGAHGSHKQDLAVSLSWPDVQRCDKGNGKKKSLHSESMQIAFSLSLTLADCAFWLHSVYCPQEQMNVAAQMLAAASKDAHQLRACP